MITLRQEVKNYLADTKIPITVISKEAKVPYGAVYCFKTKGRDMCSEYMQKLYEYFTGEPLIKRSDEEGKA